MIHDVIEKIEKEKQSRIPRSYDSIEKGALALALKERVELRNQLTKSIDDEIKDMTEKLKIAAELTGKQIP